MKNSDGTIDISMGSGGSGSAYSSGGSGGTASIKIDGTTSNNKNELTANAQARLPSNPYTYTYYGDKDDYGIFVCGSGLRGDGGYHQDRYNSNSSGASSPIASHVKEHGVYLSG